jgi:hypothetical protein
MWTKGARTSLLILRRLTWPITGPAKQAANTNSPVVTFCIARMPLGRIAWYGLAVMGSAWQARLGHVRTSPADDIQLFTS